jgi:tripartite-type tricarboxylate transporter receptor subunit TctC
MISRHGFLATCFAAGALLGSLIGANAADDFYKGKTITFMVGFSSGGGYDSYARLLAHHLPNHIPGAPTIIVQNMDGAGSMRAANHVYNVAPKDGTVIAAVNATLLMYQLLGGKGAQYDPAKLQWIGSVANSNNSVITWHASGIRTVEDAKNQEVPMAGTGTTSYANIYPTIMNAVLGTRFRVINGYTGSNLMDLAIERGEVAGRSGAALASVFSEKPDWVRDKKINFLVQIGYERDPALADVPTLGELATSERDKQIVNVVTLPTTVGYAYWLAPEVPTERLATLREAFAKTISDPNFLADAKKQNLDIKVQTGEQLEALVKAAAQTPKEVLEVTAKTLGWQ